MNEKIKWSNKINKKMYKIKLTLIMKSASLIYIQNNYLLLNSSQTKKIKALHIKVFRFKIILIKVFSYKAIKTNIRCLLNKVLV